MATPGLHFMEVRRVKPLILNLGEIVGQIIRCIGLGGEFDRQARARASAKADDVEAICSSHGWRLDAVIAECAVRATGPQSLPLLAALREVAAALQPAARATRHLQLGLRQIADEARQQGRTVYPMKNDGADRAGVLNGFGQRETRVAVGQGR